MFKWFFLVLAPILSGCWLEGEPDVIRLSGETMGTSYNIVAIGDDLDEQSLAQAVEARLIEVNARMSNWDPNSEVSRFSATSSIEPVPISEELLTVIEAANDVHFDSEGKFDITLGPLIELWGFGPRTPQDPVPSESEVQAALEEVGQGRFLLLDPDLPSLTKTISEVGINLSAIAKGYGVDAVAETLQGYGVENYLVEIGGDLATRGQNDKGQDWRIGIEKPQTGAQAVQLVVPVSGYGMATSGDYRNYFEHEGRRYSHILDPTTGYPVTHHTTSVTVLSPTAMMADAWATAMLVLGLDEGLSVAERHKLAVFFIERDVQGDGESYMTAQSSAFSDLLNAH